MLPRPQFQDFMLFQTKSHVEDMDNGPTIGASPCQGGGGGGNGEELLNSFPFNSFAIQNDLLQVALSVFLLEIAHSPSFSPQPEKIYRSQKCSNGKSLKGFQEGKKSPPPPITTLLSRADAPHPT